MNKVLSWLLKSKPVKSKPVKYGDIPYLNRQDEIVWPDGTTTPYDPYSSPVQDRSQEGYGCSKKDLGNLT